MIIDAIVYFLIFLFLFGGVVFLLNLLDNRELLRIKELRQEYSRAEFLRDLEKKRVSPELGEITWSAVREELNVRDFPVYPEDSLSDLFGIVDEDQEELIQRIADSVGLGIPEDIRYDEINTVEEMALAIQDAGKAS